jgi:hypothetical protein
MKTRVVRRAVQYVLAIADVRAAAVVEQQQAPQEVTRGKGLQALVV